MGGESKLLRPFRGKPLVVWAAAALCEAGLAPVVAVLGPEPERLRRTLEGLGVQFVENTRHAEGMATSLRAGVGSLSPETAVVVVALGDMPLVSAAVIERLVAALQTSGKTIAVPTHGGCRGHPVVFDLHHHRASLLALSGDQGARSLLAARPGDVVEVEVAEGGVLLDADTPEAFDRLETAGPPSPRGGCSKNRHGRSA